MLKRIPIAALMLTFAGCLARNDAVALSDFTFTLSATPAHVPADASSAAVVALVATARGGAKPLAGQQFTFFSADPNVVFVQPSLSDSMGTSRGSVHSNSAGTVVLGASLLLDNRVAVVPASTTVTFDPLPNFVGIPDVAHSTLSANPNAGIAADGVTPSNLSVLVQDRYGAPVAHQAVALTSTGSNNVLTPQSSFTNGQGIVTATLVTTTAETKTVTADVQSYALTTSVTFAMGAASSLQSTFVANPNIGITANGALSTLLTVVVKDALGNPVPDQPVAFTSTGSNNTFTQSSATTDATGTATSHLTSTKAEAKVVSADFGTFTKTASVTFVAGPAAAATSSVTASPSAQITADGATASLLTAHVNDAYGNAVTGQAVTFTSTGSRNTLNPNLCSTAASGSCTGNLSSTKAEVKTVQASFGGLSVTTTATFVGGPATQPNSTLVINPTSVVADNSSSAGITLTLRDAYGNLGADQNVTLQSSGTGDTFSPLAGRSSGGVFSSYLSSTKAQPKTITATFGALSESAAVTFIAGTPSSINSTFTANPNSNIYASGTRSSALTVTFIDAFGNIASNQNVALSSNGSNNAFSLPTGTTDVNGIFTSSLTSLTGELKTISASNNGTLIKTVQVTFLRGLDAAKSAWTAAPSTAPADGVSAITFTLNANDVALLPIANANVTLGSTVTGATFSPNGGPTNAAGVFSTAMTSIYAGFKNVSAYIAGGFMTTRVSFSAITPYCAGSAFRPSLPWIPVATGMNGVATADFNGDAISDIAVVSNLSLVETHMGVGNGLFANANTVGISVGATSLVTGDFNEDGHQDVASSVPSSNNVSLLAGLGDGTMASQVVYPVCASPQHIVRAKLNNDAHLDVAVTCAGSNSVAILLGTGTGAVNGTGVFAAHVDYPVGSGPQHLAAADVNGDTFIDLAVTNGASNTVTVLLNNGSGVFTTGGTYAVGPSPIGIAALDLNADNAVDLAIANNGNNTVSILYNTGSAFSAQSVLPVSSSPYDVQAANVAGDGKPDLVVSNNAASSVSILTNLGSNTFASQVLEPTGSQPRGVILADVNGDGLTDILAAAHQTNSITLITNDGLGTWSQPPQYAVNSGAQNLVVADFNGDGNMDVGAVNYVGSPLSILMGHGDGTFAAQASYPVSISQSVAIALTDFNGDGHTDVALVGAFSGNVAVLLNSGIGTFPTSSIYPVGQNPSQIATADFDSDGLPDLAVVNHHDSTLSILRNIGAGIMAAQVVYPTGQGPAGLVKGDFNGDSAPDLVVVNATDDTLGVILNRGDGTFFNQAAFGSANFPGGIVAADLNGDGLLDLGALTTSGQVQVFLNQGSGTFATAVGYGAGSAPKNVTVGDFNGDGWPDLGVTSPGDNSISILLGIGDGTFSPAKLYAGGASPSGIVAADFNKDGRYDLAASGINNGEVSVLLYNGCY